MNLMFYEQIVTLGILPTMIVTFCVVTKPSTRWTARSDVSFALPSSCQHVGIMKTMSFWQHLSVPKSDLINYVTQAQTVTDETDKSGGSEESYDEVGAVDGSGITRGAHSERTWNSTDYSCISSKKKIQTPT